MLYAFRLRDRRSEKWTRARYRASLVDIAGRYAEWELIGEPEYRSGEATMFSLFRRLGREETLDVEPVLDPAEAWIAAYFLRRYVTYCARQRRFDAMQGAARLLRQVTMTPSA